MPKKGSKKAGREKPPAVLDGLSTEEMNRDQLWEHLLRLREEVDREREKKNYVRQERDKLQALWDIAKMKLKEAEAELRVKRREKEEAEERHRAESSVYKQRLKHVLSEQHSTVTDRKIQIVSSASEVQKDNMEEELALRRDLQDLQTDVRQKKLQNVCSIKDLQLKQHQELLETTHQEEDRLRELERKHQKKMEALMEAAEERLKKEVAKVEEKMKARVESLMKQQQQEAQEAVELYSATQRQQQEIFQRQQKERQELDKEKRRVRKQLSEAQKEKQRLTEELSVLQQRLLPLQELMKDYPKNRDMAMNYRRRLKALDQKKIDQTVKNEFLRMDNQKVEEECEEVRSRILDVQLKRRLKSLRLERKIEEMTETVEKKEAQLCAALSVCSSDPAVRRDAAAKLEMYDEAAGSRHPAAKELLRVAAPRR